MVDFAVTGIVAHSIKPLRLAIHLALMFAAIGVLLLIYSIVSFLWIGHTVAGWPSIMAVIAILGAGQFLVLGIIGEYVGRILRETRAPPGLHRGGDREQRHRSRSDIAHDLTACGGACCGRSSASPMRCADPQRSHAAAAALILCYVLLWWVYAISPRAARTSISTWAKWSRGRSSRRTDIRNILRFPAWVATVWFAVFPYADWAFYLLSTVASASRCGSSG